MRLLKWMPLIVFIALLVLAGCGEKKEGVARVGDLVVSADEFRAALKLQFPTQGDFKSVESDRKRKVLDKLIEKKLKVNAAYDLGLENDPEVTAAVRMRKAEAVSNRFFETNVVDKFVSAEDVAEFQQRRGTELRVTHLLIGFDGSGTAATRTKAEAQKLAGELHEQIMKGTDFTQLIEKYSDDRSAESNKGDLGYFTWGTMTPRFQDAAWQLKVGEYSKPVETEYGYHILRLDDRRETPNFIAADDAETLQRVKGYLYKSNADSGTAMWNRLLDDMRSRHHFEVDLEAINEISKLINERMKNSDKPDLSMFSDEEKERAFARWDEGKVSLNSLTERYLTNIDRVLGTMRDAKKMEREVQNQALLEMVMLEAEKQNIDQDEMVLASVQSYEENRLELLAERKEVNEKILITDEAVKEYYDNNQNNFRKPAEIEFWEIFVKDEERAQRVFKEAKKGQRAFSDLARQYSSDSYYGPRGGYVGFRTVTSRGDVSRAAFEAGPGGKIAGPIKYRNGYAIIKTGQKNEETLRPLDEVQQLARTRLRSTLLREKKTEWEKSLREKYEVEINQKLMDEI